jgi:putative oxidoreductase
MNSRIVFWLLRIVPAVILLQTLFFKFSAAPVSVWIFTQMHMEPWGRIGTGVGELIAAFLLLIPKTSWYGAVLAIGLMLGAIASHIFVLGIDVMGDGGKVFALAIVTLLCCVAVFFLTWKDRPAFVQRII